MKGKLYKTLIPLLFPALMLSSCQKEKAAVTTAGSCFSLVLEEAGAIPTRSLLQSADIETKVTSVTLGLYRGGELVEAEHYGSGWDQMAFPLEEGVYTAYALVNMGDMRDALPENESAIPSLTYSIPGYLDANTGIEYRGIPMAGSLTYTVGVSTSGAIPVKRLLAKVTASLSCEWSGVISAVKVYNLNRKLKPFGASAAASADDILSVQEFQAGSGTASGTFVFYVPENLQGNVSAIANPEEKSPEGNADVNGRKARLTYLETTVTGVSGVEGSIQYRSFLGGNATTDFDIHRNWRYTWTLRFLPDGRLHNDWKHENNLSWSEYRYSISPEYIALYQDETASIRVYRNEDKYIHGTFHANAGNPVIFSDSFNWSYGNDDSVISGVLSGDVFYVTGTGSGTRRVTATGPGSSGTVSLHCDVYAMNYKRRLLLLADHPRAAVGETIKLRALVYTTQNGQTSFWGNVVDDYMNCSIFRMGTPGSNPVQAASGGILTASAAGRERFSASYVFEPDGKTIYAHGLYVEFEQTRTGDLIIEGADVAGTTGSTLQLQARFVQYNNGNVHDIASSTDVTAQANWKIQDGEYGFYVSSYGSVSSSAPGPAVVQATYTAPNGLTYEAQAVAVFNSW